MRVGASVGWLSESRIIASKNRTNGPNRFDGRRSALLQLQNTCRAHTSWMPGRLPKEERRRLPDRQPILPLALSAFIPLVARSARHI